ncbi:hypothetical protein [Paenibacillus sp. TH7-28]
MKKSLSLPCLLLVLSALLLHACGKDTGSREEAGSFGAAASVGTAFSYEVQGPDTAESEKPDQEPGSNNNPADKEAVGVPEAAEVQKAGAAADTPAGTSQDAAAKADAAEADKAGEKTADKPKSADAGRASASSSKKPDTAKAGQSKASGKNVAAASSKSAGSGGTAKAETSGGASESARTSSSDKVKGAKSGVTTIGWSEFFDGDDQTTPSERFWDLSGSTVTIKGFMGEVLSFENHWFLLIPEPGAECPFDNGDETYWNKIMIVFVPDDVNLRYKSEALQITGRLDVGIKIDESGYKTMFRLYDASFEEIKE